MAHFISLLPSIWPWLILITAQICAVSGQNPIGFALLALFGIVSLATGLVDPVAVTIVVSGIIGAAFLHRLSGAPAALGHVALVLWCLALGIHVFPGFHNLLVLDQVRAGPDSTTFTMYLNLDKPMILFAVLVAWPSMIKNGNAFRAAPMLIGLALLPALFLLGLTVGAIHPEFGIPPWWLVFAMSNLFLTCLTEEAFFRGYLQSALSSKIGTICGVAIASVLFGFAHIAGGLPLVAFATILGAACGLGYYATGRLWVPVLMHFAFNAAHLILFTYPGPA